MHGVPDAGTVLVDLSLGFIIGLLGGLTGGGGGFFLAPYLMLVSNFSPTEAAGTSLSQVFANSATASLRNFLRRRPLDGRLAAVLAAGMMPGAVFGPVLLRGMATSTHQLIFGGVLFAAGVYLLLPQRDAPEGRKAGPGGIAGMFFVALGAGFLSSMLGIGAGFIHVPLIIYLLSMNPRDAAATSQAAMVCSSLAGLGMYAVQGEVDWLTAAVFLPGTVGGAALGSWAATRVAPAFLRGVIAVICWILSAQLIWKGLQTGHFS